MIICSFVPLHSYLRCPPTRTSTHTTYMKLHIHVYMYQVQVPGTFCTFYHSNRYSTGTVPYSTQA